MKVSIIIPAYNERKRLPRTLRIISNYFMSHSYSYEIIVVSDGSTDGTVETIQKMALENLSVIEYQPNQGKGYAVRRGFQEASGDVILLSDADLSTPISEYGKLYSYLEQRYEVAIGSRGLKSSEVNKPQRWYRRWMGKSFNKMVKLFLLKEFEDTQCGFKLFTAKAVREITPYMSVKGFAFDVEIAVIAMKKGLKIVEIPVKWYNSEESRVIIWRDPLRMIKELLSIYWKMKMGKYENKQAISR